MAELKNRFDAAKAATDRKKEMQQLETQNGLDQKAPKEEASIQERVHINLSMTKKQRDLMDEKARKMGITRSALLQLWINQNCD